MTADQSKVRKGKAAPRTGSGPRFGAGLTTVFVLAFLTMVLWPELPAWRLAGTNAIALPSVGDHRAANLCPRAGSAIELRGDSVVAGERMGGDAAVMRQKYGDVLRKEFGNGVQIISQGIGGITALKAEQHWKQSQRQGPIVILAFGMNDAAPRGWLGGKQPSGLVPFKASMRRQIERLQSQNATVALIAPNPAGSTAINRRISPYRIAIAQVAQEAGVPLFDPSDAFGQCQSKQPLLAFDALHLNQAGHECLGQWLAKSLCAAAPK